MSEGNQLYYGDNLEVLRRYVADESVDVVYLDPPFNSNANYNVLFAEQDGSRSAGQIEVFTDTWHWDQVAVRSFEETVESGGGVADALIAMRTFLGPSDMLAYLSMMAPRLSELRRVLKSTGCIYLHCDPTASHYLKLLMDAIYGPERFLNEIVWKRSSAHSGSKKFAPVHDVILFYSKGPQHKWNPAFQPIPQETIDAWYNNIEAETGRRFNRADLTAAGVRTGQSGQPWRGVDPTSKGRHWAIPSFVGEIVQGLQTHEALDALDSSGRIYWPKKKGGVPMLKRYLEESPGVPALDIITDIPPLNNATSERLGYPTQKPLALLELFIKASSDAGDIVLDPFCGCGTAVDAAQRLGRNWIGIDITHLSINLIKNRLTSAYGSAAQFAVIGEPTDVASAKDLASSDPYQFQWWALGLVGARPVEQKKGADHGIDGRLFFHDEEGAPTKQVIFSVKAGHVTVSQLRDLRGVVEREHAAIGVLISMEEPTRPMRAEAADAGSYEGTWGQKYPRLQLLTITELLGGTIVDMPELGALAHNVTNKPAPKVSRQKQQGMF